MITYHCDSCGIKLVTDRIWYNRSRIQIVTYSQNDKRSETEEYQYCEDCIDKINHFIKKFNK